MAGTGFSPPGTSEDTPDSLAITTTSDSSITGPLPALPALVNRGHADDGSSVRSFASTATDSVTTAPATTYAAYRNTSRSRRAAITRQNAIADRPRRGPAPAERAEDAGPIALGARAGELWEVAEPLPHVVRDDGDGMDTSDFSGAYVVQQNVAIDAEFNQQNNLQFVHVDATTNQLAQVQVGVDPQIALELQHRATAAERDAHQVRAEFQAQAQQADAKHAAVVGQITQHAEAKHAAVVGQLVDSAERRIDSANQALASAQRDILTLTSGANEAVARGSEETLSARQRIAELERQLAQSQARIQEQQTSLERVQVERSRRPPLRQQFGKAEHFPLTPPRTRGNSPDPATSGPEAPPRARTPNSGDFQSPGSGNSYNQVVEERLQLH